MVDTRKLDRLLVAVFLASFPTPPAVVIVDLDATDLPLHGTREERFFHGYYRACCYMPLMVLIGGHPVLVRSAGRDAAAGVEKDPGWLLDRLRTAWPATRIIVRTDSGFCREAILAACERRVIGKAEALPPAQPGGQGKRNPRFIVTSLPAATHPARELYERLYCARGEAENRVKEHELHLFSRRCSSNLFGANTLRFYLSTFAMILFRALREALRGTRLAAASADRLRLRLLRTAALVRTSVRRIHLAMSSTCPDQDLFRLAWARLHPT